MTEAGQARDEAGARPRVTRVGASWVVPVDEPPIRGGRVAIRDGRIVWVGSADDPGEPEGPLVDLGAGVLLPGPVNAHTHLELSALGGLSAGGAGFVPWVEALVAARPLLAPDEARRATAAAVAGLVAAGTAAVGDISNALAHLDLLAAAPFDSVVFHELIGWDPSRAERTIEEAEARQSAALAESTTPASRVTLRLAAHTPQSVSGALLRSLVRRDSLACIHVAESPAEVEFLRSGGGVWAAFLESRGLRVPFDAPGTSPVRYLDALGVLRPGLVAVHCVHVDDEELGLLVKRGVKVVLCPRSNRSLDVGRAPLPRMLAAGLQPGLGSDSLASSPSLDVLEEATLLHRDFPLVPTHTLVRMATRGGAEALGLADLGRLAPGHRAFLAFARADAGLSDPEGFLVSGEARTERVVLPE